MDTLLRQVIHYKSIDSLDVCLVKSIRLPPSDPPCRFPPRILGEIIIDMRRREGRRREGGAGRQCSRVTRINYVRPLAFKSLFNCKRRCYLLAAMRPWYFWTYAFTLDTCPADPFSSYHQKLKRFRIAVAATPSGWLFMAVIAILSTTSKL